MGQYYVTFCCVPFRPRISATATAKRKLFVYRLKLSLIYAHRFNANSIDSIHPNSLLSSPKFIHVINAAHVKLFARSIIYIKYGFNCFFCISITVGGNNTLNETVTYLKRRNSIRERETAKGRKHRRFFTTCMLGHPVY